MKLEKKNQKVFVEENLDKSQMEIHESIHELLSYNNSICMVDFHPKPWDVLGQPLAINAPESSLQPQTAHPVPDENQPSL
jgi:hypothetical protein